MTTEPFVPLEFEVPGTFEGPGFRLEPLGERHNERDYDAWMSSIEHIQSTPGFGEGRDWPSPMSLESNRSDLIAHDRDFADRTGFTYSIVDGDEVIGCVYIYPSKTVEFDAEVSSWVRESRAQMDPVVYWALAGWLRVAWPFTNSRYAPRD